MYYATLSRLIFTSAVKVYEAQAKLMWEETVTKYRDEAVYRTEYVNEEYNTNLYLYSRLPLIAIGIIGIILQRVKPRTSLASKQPFSVITSFYNPKLFPTLHSFAKLLMFII